ncbi:CocE/NonD family hydrolase [Ponticoccus alexandrii]|uniref:CocE/NonD family hydrolase n=1 Tax=Ponticoccus alexandrii TaxID=1943633 RepID=A0ABX7FA39_9RHOB|nr:CocE/NonD family hydrolase [Ponticoccus alexandrii]ETA53884.1 hydrolase [Rhodobacteraceae bacterium PD-2]QRF67258.1 CocE/NonD family hydrolase [Ponticoccus alexandrii]
MTQQADLNSRVSAYEAGREVPFSLPKRPQSCYLTMRDGCRIAVDVWCPEGAPEGARFPTLLLFTPYFRRFRLAEGSDAVPNPNTAKFSDYFVPRGYAVVVIDVRGTGASFGTRDGFRSPTERLDSAEIADWVIAQPWSNGDLGATGISYLGAAADFLASTGHPAVKAIAPLFSVWDTYVDNYFPGGMQCTSLTQIYDTLMKGLDLDQRGYLKDYKYYAHPDYQGPQPVDADTDGSLVAAAVAEHQANFRQTDFMADLAYREEGLPYDPGYSSASISPYAYAAGMREDVAILSVSGWMDGAGYANGAIARFLTMDKNPHHLVLGPWDHGARIDVSPWRESEDPGFPLLGCVLRFFDTYLIGRETGLKAEPPVSYFAMHEEAWADAHSWPPQPTLEVLHPGPTGALGQGRATGTAEYQCVPHTRTGFETRYERIAGLDSRNYYADWQGRTAEMLSWDSAPFDEATRIAGHALLDLHAAFDAPDAGVFVYLTEVEADGTERYITEGVLRAIFRDEAETPESIRINWPYRTFSRDSARPLPEGQVEAIRIPLLPTAWTLSQGSRLRLSIAGADADHFKKVPHGRMARISVDLAKTRLDLPVVKVEGPA